MSVTDASLLVMALCQVGQLWLAWLARRPHIHVRSVEIKDPDRWLSDLDKALKNRRG